MLDLTLTPDRATPMLVLKHWSLYKCKPTIWCVCERERERKWHEGGGIYRVLGLVPLTWLSQFSGGGWLGGHHVLWANHLGEIGSLVATSWTP
jgi:hypothetical protein